MRLPYALFLPLTLFITSHCTPVKVIEPDTHYNDFQRGVIKGAELGTALGAVGMAFVQFTTVSVGQVLSYHQK
jgi:hypothetical protein